jgi:RimJ/RimL family protein N-acetyltransferase
MDGTVDMRDRLLAPIEDGDLVLTQPIEADRAYLAAACAADPDVWAFFPSDWGPAGFDATFDAMLPDDTRCPFVIRLNGAVVGMSGYINFALGRETVEIGNTYILPSLRGGVFNVRVKHLLLNRAFACGIRRVEFRVDERNARSQAAVLKLGAVKEGVLRAERVTWTGHVRDTGIFSLLADEWTR